MALSKKYAGLPDLDAAPEIYETPELTDDASTVQTGTIRTESPSPSHEDVNQNDGPIDRRRIDRDEAARRFEPALVDAKNVDFSDNVAGGRRSYKTTHRRRRRRPDGTEELGDDSDFEEESAAARLARLRRETEELRKELEREDRTEFQDSLEQKGGELEDGIHQLSEILDGLHASSRMRNGLEGVDIFGRLQLSNETSSQKPALGIEKNSKDMEQDMPGTLAAVASFSDRLTLIESALGVAMPGASDPASVLPTLQSLSDQMTALSTALNPTQKAGTSDQPRTILRAQSTVPSFANLDILSARMQALVVESDKLAKSRKAAQQSLTELHEAQEKHRRDALPLRFSNSRPSSSHDQQQAQLDNQQAKAKSELFLDEQANKIVALYQILPTIQDLQPLLPLVLERLKALSVLHNGADAARSDMDEVERNQEVMKAEVERWRDAVSTVEQGIVGLGQSMKGNVDVVGAMVRDLENRIGNMHASS